MILIIKSGQLAYAGTVSGKSECMVTLLLMVPISSGHGARVKSAGKVSGAQGGLCEYVLLFVPKTAPFPRVPLL